jgi:hypothetical protein
MNGSLTKIDKSNKSGQAMLEYISQRVQAIFAVYSKDTTNERNNIKLA